jgi:hypothetical protein
MKNVLEHDDHRDMVAHMLREQADRARMRPSTDLRARTLAGLRQPASPVVMHRTPSSWWSWSMAAAAMIALAVVASWMLRPSTESNPSFEERSTRSLHMAFSSTREPLVRVASFTQPLQREAVALRDDLTRLAEHVRNAMPRFDPPASRQSIDEQLTPNS